MKIKIQNVNPEELKKLETALNNNDALVEELNKAEDAKAVQKILEANGLRFSEEDVLNIQKGMDEALGSDDGDLREEDLETVAGGGTFTLAEIEWKVTKNFKIKVCIPW